MNGLGTYSERPWQDGAVAATTICRQITKGPGNQIPGPFDSVLVIGRRA